MDATTCSAEAIEHLVQRCLEALRSLPFAKKKHISGLLEIESVLHQLRAKIRAQEATLRNYADVAEIKQLLLALQDTLTLLLRKHMSISKRRYFLDAAYGKRMMLLLQQLTNNVSELFMSLSRLVIVDSIEVQRRNSLGTTKENARAQNNLAVLLMESDPQSAEAERLLEMSAAKGLAIAQNNLGLFLESCGRRQEALEAYESAVAASYSPAVTNLGYLLSLRAMNMTQGTQQKRRDLQRARSLLETAAAQGSPEAHLYLGFLLDSQGTKEEISAMIHLQTGIAQTAPKWPLRRSSPDGMIARQDFRQYQALVAQAASRIADIHYRRHEYALAMERYRLAAKLGHADALNALGLMCESGKCLSHHSTDLERAKELYRSALAQGCADAGFNLAALALREGNAHRGEARNYLKSALTIDPSHERALHLSNELNLL
ncbi:Actin binding protein, putative [Hondaea fermentalgiana]|uniref:Actin binding protein, putative n=1 Tax=Hondaea fermentalgiana TaxID=2315210 RepID=A0A2R5GI58_9STRA|nr:Actin binding protein, putative [Hondaea fermentalgiana]|eukprot:GBG30580.1 Actin binding protein, putative [Hondaea fermentalgiana]